MNAGVHLGFEKAGGGPPLGLRKIQCDVSITHQGFVGDTIPRGHGHADADPAHDLVAAHVKRLRESRRDAGRQDFGVIGLLNRKLDDGELIPANTRDRIAIANAAPEPVGDRHQ